MTTIELNEISKMSLYELQGAVKNNTYSMTEIRTAYSALRERARGRTRTVTSAKNQAAFRTEKPRQFATEKQLKTNSDLLRELHDVNQYLNSYRSTVKGLEKHRENTIAGAAKWGINVTNENYADYLEFMEWFRSSEYAVSYDSGSSAVKNAFNGENVDSNAIRKAWEEYKAAMQIPPSITGTGVITK